MEPAGLKGPTEPGGGKAPQILGDGASGDGAALGDLAFGESTVELQTQHFTDLSHGQPRGRHDTSSNEFFGGTLYRLFEGLTSVAFSSVNGSRPGGRLAPEQVAAFLRNQWPESPEYAIVEFYGIETLHGDSIESK